jgi:hypothetical protein
LSFAGRFKRRNGIVGLRVGYLTEALGGRGILHGERFALGGVTPFAADEQLLFDAVDDGLFRDGGAYVATVSLPSSSEIATSME